MANASAGPASPDRQIDDLLARKAFYSHLAEPFDFQAWALDIGQFDRKESVLDVGCGGGPYLRALEERSHAGLLVGVDPSVPMLSRARELGLRSPLVRGNGVQLPIRECSLDVVLLMHVLYDVSARTALLEEARRVLRLDGVVVCFVHSMRNLAELNALIGRALDASGAAITSPGWNYLRFPAEDTVSALRVVFDNVEEFEAEAPLRFSSAEPVVNYARSSPALRDELTDEQCARVVSRLRADAEDILGEHGSLTVNIRTRCFRCQP